LSSVFHRERNQFGSNSIWWNIIGKLV